MGEEESFKESSRKYLLTILRYSRLNGAGAFVTTFGPGELSAYCGHAGAYAEFCPVVHIVGYPGVTAMKNHTLMHHSLGTGEFK